MNDTVYTIALAGLLHDIGKFMQRAELEKDFSEIRENYEEFCPDERGYLHAAHTAYFIQHFVPDGLVDKKELYLSAHHHVSGPGDLYREADCLSSGMERYGQETESANFKEVRLNSVFDMVEVQYVIRDKNGNLNSRWKHYLTPVTQRSLREQYPQFVEGEIFPDHAFTYRRLWEGFIAEVEDLIVAKDISYYFNEIFWLLEKYTCCIPSATNVFPDISLFDHAKTAAAIVSAQHLVEKGEREGEADFILYGGDISGIQEYIFKISQSQGVGGIAKRLRGRSFYIAMLSEVLSRYLLDKLDLTLTNVNFCGGGNFELLLPNSISAGKKLNTFEQDVNDWLLEQFHGQLGFVGARVTMTRKDLRTAYADKKNELNDALTVAKLKKYRTHLDQEGFWQEKAGSGKKTVCRSCNLNLIISGDVCGSCDQDRKIGELLPLARYISFSKSAQRDESLYFGKFGSVTLLEQGADIPKIRAVSSAVYALDEEAPGVKALFRLARTVPKALTTLDLPSEEDENANSTVYAHRPLSFTTLADMACGDKRIGILKMDVDNLGFIFSLGLKAPPDIAKQGNLISISRLSTMSRQMVAFFTTHLDAICLRVFEKWRDDPENRWENKDSVSNIFYLIFAGGDDLVIVGPWDRIIELAREIRKEFTEFTSHNPNITLSAGIYICKPKYPIGHAVEKAEEALKQSKDKGRNRITVMGETAVWAHENPRSRVFQETLKTRYARFAKNEISSEEIFRDRRRDAERVGTLTFEELTAFSEKLLEHLDSKQISRGFVRSLLEAKEQFFTIGYNDQLDRFEEKHNLMVLPYLLYSIERNVHKSARDELKRLLVTGGQAQTYIRQAYYPCRYIFMKRR
jgi:CRISPR-associated protein Csm1